MSEPIIPRWRSLGPVSVFRNGPWEAIMLVWLAGAVALAMWLGTPTVRIAAVLDPVVATIVGVALFGMIAVRVGARLFATLEFGWPFFAAAALVGGGTAFLASRTVLLPIVERAAACAPPFPVSLSMAGRIASFALPVATWIAWCLYVTARVPVIERRQDLLATGPTSRYRAYSDAFRRLLPFRLVLTSVVIALVVSWVASTTPSLPDESTPNVLASALRDFRIGTIDRETGGATFARLATERRKRETDAIAALAALDLDTAGQHARRCACEWLAPGDRADSRVSDAAEAFAVLDEQVKAYRTYALEPAPATASAIVRLLPLNVSTQGAALFPEAWATPVPTADTGMKRQDFDSEVRYSNETVLVLRRTMIGDAPHQRLVSVSIRLLGRVARDTALPGQVSARVGKAPLSGPCSVANGAYCTTWDLGRLRARLGPDPADPQAGANAPIWLTLYDPRLSGYTSGDCCS